MLNNATAPTMLHCWDGALKVLSLYDFGLNGFSRNKLNIRFLRYNVLQDVFVFVAFL